MVRSLADRTFQLRKKGDKALTLPGATADLKAADAAQKDKMASLNKAKVASTAGWGIESKDTNE